VLKYERLRTRAGDGEVGREKLSGDERMDRRGCIAPDIQGKYKRRVSMIKEVKPSKEWCTVAP
jgi:hypothetical protein